VNEWIIVRNWGRFQHYRKRRPVWIKVYTDLSTDADWLELTDAERGLLVRIWIEYARLDGVLDVHQMGTQMSTRRASRWTLRSRLDSLCRAGWISIVASKPAGIASTTLAPETEVRDRPPKKVPNRRPKITGWREVRGSHGVSHIRDPFGTDPAPTWEHGRR
jgi:hypothetical protein